MLSVRVCVCTQAIHNDMNCKDYQDDLRIRAENDEAAKKTKQMLEVCKTHCTVQCLGVSAWSVCNIDGSFMEASLRSTTWVVMVVVLGDGDFPEEEDISWSHGREICTN